MTKRKLLPILIAVSSVFIVAGIILCALLGFNYSAERPTSKSIEVEYDVVVEITDGAYDTLVEACDKAIADNKLTVIDKKQVSEIDETSGSATGSGKLIYTLAGDSSDSAVQSAKAYIQSVIDTDIIEMTKNEEGESLIDIYVAVHSAYTVKFTEAIWRGAIAVAVGFIVALVYVGIRFGVGCAVTGLTLCVHDTVLTLALFAITRIPLYYFAPMILGAIAAFASLVMWVLQCMKMRENFKEPSYAAYSAEEAVAESVKTAKKQILGAGIGLCAAFVIIGIALACAGAPLGAILLPIVCVLPVGVSLYSSLLFGPALHVHVKKHFDKLKAKRKRYFGKAKAEKTKEN